MAVSLDSSGENFSSSNPSFAFTNTAGTMLIAFFVVEAAVTVADITAATYGGTALTYIGQVVDAGSTLRIEVWGLKNPATGSNTLAATQDGADDVRTYVTTWTGGDGTWALNMFATGTGTSATPSVSITPDKNNCAVVGALASADVDAPSTGSGETTLFNHDEGSWASAASYDIQTTAEAQSIDWTTGSSAGFVALAVALNESGVTYTTPKLVGFGALEGSASAISPPMPDGTFDNDLIVLFFRADNQVNGSDPADWTDFPDSPLQAAGATQPDSLEVKWRRRSSAFGTTDISVADRGTVNVGVIGAFRGVITTGNPYDVTSGTTLLDDTDQTDVPDVGDTTTVDNCLIVLARSDSRDATGARWSDWQNASLTSLTEVFDNGSATGNGGGIGVATGIKATAGTYDATTADFFTGTGNSKCFMTIALKPVVGTTETTKTQTGLARIQKTVDQTQTGVARIQRTEDQTQLGLSRIQKTVDQTQPGLARVEQTTTQTQTGLASVEQTTTQIQTGVSRIVRTESQTQTGVARVESTATQTQPGLSRVQQTVDQNQTGVATISTEEVTTQTQPGLARIEQTVSQTQPGLARVEQTTTQTQTGVARIVRTEDQTQTGLARVEAVATQTQPGLARVQQTTDQNITGVANITVSTQNYTYEARATLPTTETDLANSFTPQNYTDVGTANDERVSFSGAGVTIFQFKDRNDNNTDTITLNWEGQVRKDPALSPVYLQIYNYTDGAWETVDTDNTSAISTDFVLTAEISVNVEEYYTAVGGGYWIAARVYQEV